MQRLIPVVFALVLPSCGLIGDSNIDERQDYWESEFAGSIQPGTSQAELASFAIAHGVVLDCYQNQHRQDQCDFDDPQSHGGTPSRPVILSAIFAMADGKVVSYELTPTIPAPPGE